MRVRCPGEPEEADWEEEGANHHRDQPLFGYGLPTVSLHLPLESRIRYVRDDGDTYNDTDGDAEEGKSTDTTVPSSNFLECDWV